MKPKGIMRRRIVRKSKKRIKTRHKVVSISKLIKTADKLFSDAVRQIGANKEGLQVCYTCGHKNHWKKQSRSMSLAFWHFRLVFNTPYCSTSEESFLADLH